MNKQRLDEKVNKFNDLCGDWDYRNIDMTDSHLSGIDIVSSNIIGVSCERFDVDLDDYINCSGGNIKNAKLVKDFVNLNLDNYEDVLDFMSKINNYIDWKKIDDELDEIKDDEAIIIPATKLGEGWNWYKYSDGSGYLESPNNKHYMSYDLITNEYKSTPKSNYEFFPLDYYYADGVKPSEFKPFEFMEEEMLNYVLPKEKDEEISL